MKTKQQLLYKYLLAASQHFNRQRWAISSLALWVCTLGVWTLPVFAEGSNELVSDGGNRPFIEWSPTGTTAGIARTTLLKVYVQAGETVNLGSSVPNSFGGGTQDIVYRSPNGSQNGACDVLNAGFGYISNHAKEAAGPSLSVGGYTPCTFVATTTGIYEVEFHGPVATGNPPVTTIPASRATNTTLFGFQNADGTSTVQNASVGAWDITIRDGSNTVASTKTGRVFTNYVALNMGANPSTLNSNFYIQTKDGYLYKTSMNGLDPFGFIFFGNSRGFIDTLDGTLSADDTTLYRSAAGATTNALDFAGNIRVQRPDVPDTATNITHLTFILPPDAATLFQLGIPTSASLPQPPNNFKFTGGTGGSGNQTLVGVGGNFTFTSASAGSYEIIIDTDNNGIYDPTLDRVLQNVVVVGNNTVLWDGKNAAGVNLPPRAGNAPYNARIRNRLGEYHFPMLDAENNPNGFVIEMLNAPSGFPLGTNASTIYYNDDNYTTRNGTAINLGTPGTPTSPRNAATGISSSPGGQHEFSGNYGDFKGIDTWAYFFSQDVFSQLVITSTNQANVRGTKSVNFLADTNGSNTVTVGDRILYTITYSNLSPGNSNATNFVISDLLPSQLTFVSAAITSQTAGNSITLNPSYAGSGNLTNSGTLRIADTITVTVTATINNANSNNPINNQASATFNTPDNPATTGTALTDASSAGGTSQTPALGQNFSQIADDTINTGNNPANTGDDEPTQITVVNPSPPLLTLVKRITAINGVDVIGFQNGVNTSGDPNNVGTKEADDNDPFWPDTPPPNESLRGAIHSSTIAPKVNLKPGDEVE